MFDAACPTRLSPVRIGDKWGGMIILCLVDGPRRFSELRVPLHRVTAKVLTESLRALERDGLITRTAYDENPPRVEYTLTPLGRTMLEPIEWCREWARDHLPEVVAAREAYTDRAYAES